jgi:hypothetical protein
VSGSRIVTALLAVLPFVLVAVAVRWAVPAFGDRIARRLGSAVAVLRSSRPAPRVTAQPPSGGEADSGPGPSVHGQALLVHVPAAAVERALDDYASHVRGRSTRVADGEPPGVRLTGVSALGVGLRDGDVVISVEGEPAVDADTATDAALEVIARGGTVLHATALRGDQLVSITADLPPSPVAERRPGSAR